MSAIISARNALPHNSLLDGYREIRVDEHTLAICDRHGVTLAAIELDNDVKAHLIAQLTELPTRKA